MVVDDRMLPTSPSSIRTPQWQHNVLKWASKPSSVSRLMQSKPSSVSRLMQKSQKYRAAFGSRRFVAPWPSDKEDTTALRPGRSGYVFVPSYRKLLHISIFLSKKMGYAGYVPAADPYAKIVCPHSVEAALRSVRCKDALVSSILYR